MPEFDLRELFGRMDRAEMTPEDVQKKKDQEAQSLTNAKTANDITYAIMTVMLDRVQGTPQEQRPEVMLNGLAVALSETLVILSAIGDVRKDAAKSVMKAAMGVSNMIVDRFATVNFENEGVSDMVQRRQVLEDRLGAAKEDFWKARFKANVKSD